MIDEEKAQLVKPHKVKQRLIYAGKPMNDEGCLAVTSGSEVYHIHCLCTFDKPCKHKLTLELVKNLRNVITSIPPLQITHIGVVDNGRMEYYDEAYFSNGCTPIPRNTPQYQVLSVKSLLGKILALQVRGHDSIRQSLMYEREPDQQRLSSGGKQLRDRIGHTLDLSLSPFGSIRPVYAKTPKGCKISFEIHSGDTVKSKIKSKEGIPLHQQWLFCTGELIDDWTLTSCNIEPQPILQLTVLQERMQIIVLNSTGGRYYLEG